VKWALEQECCLSTLGDALLNSKVYCAAIRTAFFAGFLIAYAAPIQAAQWPRSDIPSDPAVTFGVLPNGMRYAIMQNSTPTGEVSVRFRIGAGSMQESAAQRGLAHFLEHMAFRGSAHIADGEIEKSLERSGLSFGSDTNASTDQDQTVYQFDLPKSDDQTVDTVLSFTREIASNLTLDHAAAKTEAGVVLSELKLRDQPSFRALKSQLDFVLQDPHATALANGDPAIIAQAPTALIRDYYQAYYRPERATLIVVGDIDTARMEAKIKERFADWRGIGAPGGDPQLTFAQSRGLEAKLFTEPGASSKILLAWVRPPEPKPDDAAREKSDLIDVVGLQILNRRLREAAASPTRPFTRAGASREQILRAAELVTLSIGYEPDHWQTALDTADRIRLAVLQSGVSQAEVDRAVAELHMSFQGESVAANTRPSPAIADSILEEVAENDVFTSPARDLAKSEEDLKDLKAHDVTHALRNVFRGSGPLIFVSGSSPIKGSEQAVKTAFLETEKSALSAPISAVQPPALNSWPYTNFGRSGAVVETEQVSDLGTTFVRFANGVRLTIRPSKLRANQVLVSVKVGGGRLDLPTDRLTAAWAAGAVPAGGLKAMSYTDMQRILAPKNYRVGFSVREDGFVFSGGTTPTDIDTQLQVLAAYVQAPGFRPEGFEQVRSSYAARLRQVDANPAAIMQLKAPEILHNGDKRWVSPSGHEVQTANVEELKSLLAPAFVNGAVDITIVGDITTDKAVQSVAATFGAFPKRAEARPTVGVRNNTHFPAGPDAPITIPGSVQTGQEIVSVAWPTHGQFPDIQENVTLELMSAIMEDRLFDRLRGLGTVYVAQVGNTSSKVFDYGYVQALAQLPPDQAQQFYDAVNDIVADLEAGKLAQDDLARAKNPALQELRKAQQTNEYWLSILDDAQEKPGKLDLARKYEAALQQVTLSDIGAAARKYLAKPHMIKLATGS
jgi:zinc protease